MFSQPERLTFHSGRNKEMRSRVVRCLTFLDPSVWVEVFLFMLVDPNQGHKIQPPTFFDLEAIVEHEILRSVTAHSRQRATYVALSLFVESVAKVHLGKSLSGPAKLLNKRDRFLAEYVNPFGMFTELPHSSSQLLKAPLDMRT